MFGTLYLFLGLSAAGALVVLGLGIGLATYKSDRIARAVRSLIAPALALGRGEAPSIQWTEMREANEVGKALVNAFELLQHRTNERDRAERDKQVAEGAAHLKSEFVATVSHEMRTPLTSIAASLGLLAGTAYGTMPDPARRLIKIAHANSARLVRLINDILDIEKLESGKVMFDLQHVDVQTLVEQALEANRPLAESFGVTLCIEPASARVHADPNRLTQVITNLLSNAIKFSPPGANVVVAIRLRSDCVRISVRDHGPGIPEAFRPHIFNRFAQASLSEAGQMPGSGLGLSIAKQIVVRLGGEIGFVDARGGGTVFFVDIPRSTVLPSAEDGLEVALA